MTTQNLAPKGMALVFIIGFIVAIWPLIKDLTAFAARKIKIQNSFTILHAMTPVSRHIILAILFVASTASIAGGGYNPFIYFRF